MGDWCDSVDYGLTHAQNAESLYSKLSEGEPDALQWTPGELQILEELKQSLATTQAWQSVFRKAVSLVCYG